MGLFSGLLGNASKQDVTAAEKELDVILVTNESVRLAYKLVRDSVVFTDFRMIIIDRQGVTGKKTEYRSIPYRSISRFSIETAGNFDLDAELKIWISGSELPAEVLQFSRSKNVLQVQEALAEALFS